MLTEPCGLPRKGVVVSRQFTSRDCHALTDGCWRKSVNQLHPLAIRDAVSVMSSRALPELRFTAHLRSSVLLHYTLRRCESFRCILDPDSKFAHAEARIVPNRCYQTRNARVDEHAGNRREGA